MWRCVLTMSGAQFVTILGAQLMLKLFAANWDFQESVSTFIVLSTLYVLCILYLKVLSLIVVQEMVKEVVQYT